MLEGESESKSEFVCECDSVVGSIYTERETYNEERRKNKEEDWMNWTAQDRTGLI